MSAPTQGQDLLEGVYQTPLELLRPVHRRFPLCFDLAALPKNNAINRLGRGNGYFYTEADDALAQPWTGPRIDPEEFCWLNPPFGDIEPWTTKAEAEAKTGARIVMLLPSATGAGWLEPCRRSAQIIFLIGRPVFEFINPMSHKNPAKRGKPNTDPYGKDMLLAIFGHGTSTGWWDWREK